VVPEEALGRLRERLAAAQNPVMVAGPGMELPGMDIPGIAASYGVQSERVKSLADLTHAVKDALSSDRPHLIEISQRRLADS
jgi:thiamine pyrophosphate-dependent acetolactate synthase large subunit-like protein